MRLSSPSRMVLGALEELRLKNNQSPTMKEMVGTLIGSPGEVDLPHLHGLVSRALPSVITYLINEEHIPSVPIGKGYYLDRDLGGLGRTDPQSLAEAYFALAVAGKPIWGVRVWWSGLAKKNGNGNHLWQAYVLFWRKNILVQERNNTNKLAGYVSQGWLPAGVEALTIDDISQRFLN